MLVRQLYFYLILIFIHYYHCLFRLQSIVISKIIIDLFLKHLNFTSEFIFYKEDLIRNHKENKYV